MSLNLFGTSGTSRTSSTSLAKTIIGTTKTPDQLAKEAAAEKEKLENANSIEMETIKATSIPYPNPLNPNRVHVGGRRRKSRRGKSRKYKRTLKRRKNKTKNRK